MGTLNSTRQSKDAISPKPWGPGKVKFLTVASGRRLKLLYPTLGKLLRINDYLGVDSNVLALPKTWSCRITL